MSLAYRAGYTASGQLLVFGLDCQRKARVCAEAVLAKVAAAGFQLEESYVECLGAGAGAPGMVSPPADLPEVVLRIAVRDSRLEAVKRFARELAPLITSGPAGLAGYASGRPVVRPVFAYWPTLAPKDALSPAVDVRPARSWLRS